MCKYACGTDRKKMSKPLKEDSLHGQNLQACSVKMKNKQNNLLFILYLTTGKIGSIRLMFYKKSKLHIQTREFSFYMLEQ